MRRVICGVIAGLSDAYSRKGMSLARRDLIGPVLLAFIISVSLSGNSPGAVVKNNNGIENGMFTGNVIWGGDNTDKHPLMIPLAGNVFFTSFCWTSGQFDMINKTAVCHPGYQPFTNGPPGKKYNFYQPMDNTITDWMQNVTIRIRNGAAIPQMFTEPISKRKALGPSIHSVSFQTRRSESPFGADQFNVFCFNHLYCCQSWTLRVQQPRRVSQRKLGAGRNAR